MTASVPIRDRSTEEPRGRWENRCEFTHHIAAGGVVMVCDRPRDHLGYHTGRVFTEIGWSSGKTRVLGWARFKS